VGELFFVDVFVEDVACQPGDFAFGFVGTSFPLSMCRLP